MKCLLKFVGSGEKEVVEQAGMWPDRQAWLQATKENTPQADREKKVDIKKDEEVKGRIKKFKCDSFKNSFKRTLMSRCFL